MIDLPGIDFPVADWTAGDFHTEASRLARVLRAIPASNVHDRSRLAYGVVLCTKSAELLTNTSTHFYRDLRIDQQAGLITDTDQTMRDIADATKEHTP